MADRGELRARARAARRALSAGERRAADEAVADALIALLAEARCVGLFVPVRDETEAPRRLFERLGEARRWVFPRCDSAAVDMVFCAQTAWPTHPGAYGIPEPAPSAVAVPWAEIDAVLVPGLVFDGRGHRLGYGAGYYDRALPRLRDEALRVGVCYDTQYVDELPAEAHDAPVDVVVTERITMHARRA